MRKGWRFKLFEEKFYKFTHMNALLISSHPRRHTSCYNHAAHIHQLDLQRVRGSPTSDKSNPNRLSVLSPMITILLVSTHFEKLHYLKSNCPELSWSSRTRYSFNYTKKAAEINFLNIRYSMTVQNSYFKLKRLSHGSFLRNFEIFLDWATI